MEKHVKCKHARLLPNIIAHRFYEFLVFIMVSSSIHYLISYHKYCQRRVSVTNVYTYYILTVNDVINGKWRYRQNAR